MKYLSVEKEKNCSLHVQRRNPSASGHKSGSLHCKTNSYLKPRSKQEKEVNAYVSKGPSREVVSKVPSREVVSKVPSREVVSKVPSREVIKRRPSGKNISENRQQSTSSHKIQMNPKR